MGRKLTLKKQRRWACSCSEIRGIRECHASTFGNAVFFLFVVRCFVPLVPLLHLNVNIGKETLTFQQQRRTSPALRCDKKAQEDRKKVAGSEDAKSEGSQLQASAEILGLPCTSAGQQRMRFLA